ncbi:L-threonylcarbamoyladenylate synthase [Clostridium botulinum]|uniref:Threonylcarbamoyl-AMP synthase n=1 Tax=Clostridium botulinum TaxID=1491 RepID=A0A9Q1V189_CLOBO|nr:L-threonylcarbamoyladenylate synthase [Clostridium botulinum]AEB76943.1 Sua5/YciO/YrdC/YwlC family protein [Clostridium botulinum BKT015925]KEH98377.1 tRNA threonylcarbamoyladenosine biosynthesis protein [Clostridium botulinum D str. 16868]KEI05118.1 tRNA threonylcarbamoyladenosine biosynthesis protein [Clostridium botulinum C/D str. Sp77]KLU75391.1 tRNA threonylcarbamoyladenosine biosynthesis protein [Clostridium botulinum V891]KOA76247.1 tRNA threonylcarbamoyladenosine biosynthesis protei
MNTKVSYLDLKNLDVKVIEEAGEVLREGGLVAFPTETVYGLGANALDSEAVKKIFIAKGRPQDNPLIVHIADFNLDGLVEEVPSIAKKIMEKFWPGPLTLIMKKSREIPYVTSAGLESVGIRMPSNIVARELIKKSGVPIAAPSANISGKPSPTNIERCIEDLNERVEYIIGGEKCEVGLESTIVDCTINPPCVLRPGGITLEMLREIEPEIYIDPAIMKKADKDFKPKAPGMKYRHYAPKAPVKIIAGNLVKSIAKINEMVQNYIDDGKKVGIMATEETKGKYSNAIIKSLGSREDLHTIAHNLFKTLSEFDSENVDIILSEAFKEEEIGIAIMNRLKKAAGFDIIYV